MPSKAETTIRGLRGLRRDAFTEVERVEAVDAARALMARLQTPIERGMDFCLTTLGLHISVKVCIDLDLFVRWKAAGGGPKSVDELAGLVGADAALLRRMLRHLRTSYVLAQPAPDRYEMSEWAEALAGPMHKAWVTSTFSITLPCTTVFPEFLREHHYRASAMTDPRDGVFQQTFGCKGEDIFTWMARNPVAGGAFGEAMTGYGAARPGWLDFYPSETLIDDSSRTLLVDVGGGVGHDVCKFAEKHPGLEARIVLQDRPEVVAAARTAAAVAISGHDFFTPQPIQGARVYYLHSILHDWDDETAVKILENLKPALKRGYSRVLLNECVVKDSDPRIHATGLDLAMMNISSGKERDEDNWSAVVHSAGFKLVKIWSSPIAVESIIELDLV